MVCGYAPRFFASMRLDVRRTGAYLKRKDGEIYGHNVKISFKKNRYNSPRSVELTLIYGKGFDRVSDLINTATTLGVITRSGAWYVYGDRKFHGESDLYSWLSSEPQAFSEVREKTVQLARTFVSNFVPPEPEEDSEDQESLTY